MLSIAVFFGCASIGSPGGGLYDETPPYMKYSRPADGATRVEGNKIVIHFNENIKLANAQEKLTVSPPQEKSPIIQSNAKTVTIELLDSMKHNTTYSIDLGDAVQDNNEGNPLEHFSMTFSTGERIDSMMIGGTLLNAEDLEPVTGAYVGIYPDTMAVADSAFLSRPMLRAGKTDALGGFKILGVAPGQYKLYAVKDGNTNYHYDLFTEDIAFLDEVVVPSMAGEIVRDTVWNADSTAIDTILMHDHIVYSPTDLRLRLFNEGKANRYLDDYARPDSTRLTFRFSAAMPELPYVQLLKRDGDEGYVADTLVGVQSQWSIWESNPTLDTLSLWIADSSLFQRDTLIAAVSYYYTDTLKRDVLKSDTLTFYKPIVRTDKSKQKEDEGGRFSFRKKGKKKEKEAANDSLPSLRYMTIKQIYGQSLDIGKKPVFEVSEPIASIDTARMRLEMQVDTVWQTMAYRWEQDSLHLRRYTLYAVPYFSPGGSYRFSIDSAAMHDIYGAPIEATTFSFKERTREEYAHLLFKIHGIEGKAIVQLLDERDKPKQQAPVVDGLAKFVHVTPGKYFVRLVVDSNGNGRFDAGNLAERRQPEQVYYFNQELQLRANWSLSQDWTPTSVDLLKQKPEAVKINKPKQKEERKSKNEQYYGKTGSAGRSTSAPRSSASASRSSIGGGKGLKLAQ